MLRRFRLVPFIAFVIGPTAVFFWLTERHWAGLHIDTSKENAARIRSGMTPAEADAILGGSPGDYRLDPDSKFKFVCGCSPLTETWATSDGVVEVYYGCEQRPSEMARFYNRPRHQWTIAGVEWSESNSISPWKYAPALAIASTAAWVLLIRVVKRHRL